MSGTLSYDPSRFLQTTIEEARHVILTPEAGLNTDERWERETEWLAPYLRFPSASLVIDYGCGIGRLAPFVEAPVLGVDISPTMRGMATIENRGTSFFSAVTPQMLKQMVAAGLRADGALCVWVLQHAMNPQVDVELLASALLPGSPFILVNRDTRYIPVKTEDGREGWAEDKVNVFDLVDEAFDLADQTPLPEALCAPGASLRRYVRR